MPTIRSGFAHPFEELREEFDRLWGSLTATPTVLAEWAAAASGFWVRCAFTSKPTNPPLAA